MPRKPKKKPEHLAPPDVLLGIAERKERKLTKQERISVMTARRMEGHLETERQFAILFDVTHAQIHQDMSAVKDNMTAYHRKSSRNWEAEFANYTTQYLRSMRAQWSAYGDVENDKPFEKASIARSVFRTADEYVQRCQRAGFVPEAPRRIEIGAAMVMLTDVGNVVSRIFQAGQRAGIIRGDEDAEAFRRELLQAFNAEAHAPMLADASANGKGTVDENSIDAESSD